MTNANMKDSGRRSAGSKDDLDGAGAHTRKKFLFRRVRARRVISWWRRYACEWRHGAASGITIITIKWPRRECRSGVVALLTRTRAGPLMNYRYYLSVCAGESHCKWSGECIWSVYSRCAFEVRTRCALEVRTGNVRFAGSCAQSKCTRKSRISTIFHGINSILNLQHLKPVGNVV